MGGWKNYKKRKISLVCWGLVFGEEERGGKKTAELRKEVARGGQGPQGVRGGRLETTLLHPFTHSRMDLIVWGISYENHFAFFFFFSFSILTKCCCLLFFVCGWIFLFEFIISIRPSFGILLIPTGHFHYARILSHSGWVSKCLSGTWGEVCVSQGFLNIAWEWQTDEIAP